MHPPISQEWHVCSCALQDCDDSDVKRGTSCLSHTALQIWVFLIIKVRKGGRVWVDHRSNGHIYLSSRAL